MRVVMQPAPLFLAAALASLGVAPLAHAATYYVAPEGSGADCTRAQPCALGTGAELAMAGDTVILMDGIYREPLHPENSGRPDAWITFRADDCALPIIEGDGEAAVPNENGELPSGVASNTGSYLRFIGIVSRYWDSGFTNGWTGKGTTNSNGHIQYINCIGDGNGRTGMVLYSAPGITVRESIAAHNGGNPTGSWSSGIQLYAVQGTPEDNVIERNVSFENTDAERNTDGSGFIVDEHTTGATFINNLAFRNGGSCMRLTRSSNTRMLHFSCFHNGMNPNAYSPTNPGEFYFTDQMSRDTAVVANSLVAASGTEADPEAFLFPPESGLLNNVTVDSGPTPFYSDPAGTHPDFRPPQTAAAMVENQGSQQWAPEVDIGFDPRCIVKRTPEVPWQKSWWEYSIDYDYIRSIGGVAQCFRPKHRTGGADVGAYELSGSPHAFVEPDTCVPRPDEPEETEPEPGVVPSLPVTPPPGGSVTASAPPGGSLPPAMSTQPTVPPNPGDTSNGAGGTAGVTPPGPGITPPAPSAGGNGVVSPPPTAGSTAPPGSFGGVPGGAAASPAGDSGCAVGMSPSGLGGSLAGYAMVVALAALSRRRRAARD